MMDGDVKDTEMGGDADDTMMGGDVNDTMMGGEISSGSGSEMAMEKPEEQQPLPSKKTTPTAASKVRKGPTPKRKPSAKAKVDAKKTSKVAEKKNSKNGKSTAKAAKAKAKAKVCPKKKATPKAKATTLKKKSSLREDPVFKKMHSVSRLSFLVQCFRFVNGLKLFKKNIPKKNNTCRPRFTQQLGQRQRTTRERLQSKLAVSIWDEYILPLTNLLFLSLPTPCAHQFSGGHGMKALLITRL